MIQWHYAPYIFPLVIGVTLMIALAIYAARWRTVPGATVFGWLCLVVATWVSAYGLQLSTTDLAAMSGWYKVWGVAAQWVPPLWLAFILIFTGSAHWLTRGVWLLLSAYPLLTLVLVLTNDAHQLVWRSLALSTQDGVPVLNVGLGPWLWIGLAVAYLCFLVGGVLLVRRLREARHLYRRQTAAVLVGSLIPLLGNILTQLGLTPAPRLELTPFGYALSAAIFAWALFGVRLFDVLPVARSAMVDMMSEGVIVLDAQDRVLDLNPAAARLLGTDATRTVGRLASEVLHTQPTLAAHAQDPPGGTAEVLLQTESGPGYYDLRVSSLPGDQPTGAGRLLVLHDITAARQVEERVRTLNAELEARVQERTQALDATLQREQIARAEAETAREQMAFLARASTVLATSLDYPTTLTRVAQQAVPNLGDWCAVDIVDAQGKVTRVAAAHVDAAKTPLIIALQRRYPADPEGLFGFPQVIRTGQPQISPQVDPQDIAAAAQDPAHLALFQALGFRSYLCVPLVTQGRTIGALTLVMADSGRAYGPADLTLATDLARRAALAVDNARLYQAAQDAVRVRDDFLSIASHELKTPLTSLQLAVQSLLRSPRQGRPIPADLLVSRLQMVEEQSKRLTRLMNDLLDISRMAAGRLDLERETMDLAALTCRVAEQFHDELELAHCPLTVEALTPVVGCWDPTRLEQVITNLLTNAMKYGRSRPIGITVAQEGTLALVTVRDAGIGIAPEQQERIFGRFERAVAPGKFGGIGLGLYITRQIVEGHGGTIRVRSLPDQGATFTVELPTQADGCGKRDA